MTKLSITMLAVVATCAAGCVDRNASAVTVVDVPAAALSIQPAVVDTDPAPDDGMVPVVVQFYRSNDFVQLGASTAVTCNGAALPWSGLGYAGRVPIVAAGGDFVFVHNRGGVKTQLTLKVPVRPVLSSPVAGASLVRSAKLAIGYAASASAGVRPGASDGTIGISGFEQSDNGTAYLDVSGLRAGAGTIDLSRRVLSVPAGTGFQSVVATYTIASVETQVTWQ